MASSSEHRPTGLLQSREEWSERNRALGDAMAGLISRFVPPDAGRALDVGCQHGPLTDAWAQRTEMRWSGIDPIIEKATRSAGGAELLPGSASDIPFPDQEFDCIVFANVYEHIEPQERIPSLLEMKRVLKPGGVVVGQLPNPYFPIESHSRLPFMGWLPVRLQKAYWRLAPVPWEHDFYVVGVRHLKRSAKAAGLDPVLTQNYSYPPEVIPERVRWAARLLARPMRFAPWAWQFVLRKPDRSRHEQ
jgi:SAM-dependent methyltransferase